MFKPGASRNIVRGAAVLGLSSLFLFAGCSSGPKYPDSKDAVSNSLKQNNMSYIDVSQDRNKGVITLTGNVPTEEAKSQAENVAKQAAPDYTIADEIGVVPPAEPEAETANSDLDNGIEDNFKAELKKHRNLDDQSISVKSKNGTVELTGSVRTEAQKREAAKLAKAVPNVKQVVNELEVKPHKHSTAK